MIKINHYEKWKDSINEKKIKKILKIFINQLFEKGSKITLYITDDAEIQKLNKKYRKSNYPTDILSWTYSKKDFKIDLNKGSLIYGEIVISAERVLEQSKVNGWDFTTELIRLLAHGCAHISGLDHNISKTEDRKMLEVEIKLLKLIGIEGLY